MENADAITKGPAEAKPEAVYPNTVLEALKMNVGKQITMVTGGPPMKGWVLHVGDEMLTIARNLKGMGMVHMRHSIIIIVQPMDPEDE